MFHELFRWLQEDLGRSGDGMSWSQQWHSSYNLWNVMEGTHVLTIMFFAGTIWIIDLRMLGLTFKNVPFSRLNDKVLPITAAAFAAMIITGIITFIGRDPLLYYHNIWFRLKMVFLILAAINIAWFHFKVQNSQDEWDAQESPPWRVKLSGAISLTSWFLIIILGRFIAYDWFYCEKTTPGSLVYALQECDSALFYLDEPHESVDEPEAVDEEPPPDPPSEPEEAASGSEG